MSRLPWIDPDSLTGPTAALATDRYYNLIARRPQILEAWNALDKVFFGPTSVVDNHIKEEARRTLAQGAGCRFCASLGLPKEEHPDAREAVAVAVADLIATDHHQVDESTFEALREVFTDEEIVELLTWICFKLGSNIYGAIMKIDPANTEEVKGYAEFVATG
jgi:alkylhydroperoxidase family enzyme